MFDVFATQGLYLRRYNQVADRVVLEHVSFLR
jgi:hypothetical protein